MRPPHAGQAVRYAPSRQLTVPKAIHDRLKLKAGAFFLVAEDAAGRIIYTPAAVVPRPIAEAMATPSELRALKRARRNYQAGNTISYDEYRGKRAARVGAPRRPRRGKAAR